MVPGVTKIGLAYQSRVRLTLAADGGAAATRSVLSEPIVTPGSGVLTGFAWSDRFQATPGMHRSSIRSPRALTAPPAAVAVKAELPRVRVVEEKGRSPFTAILSDPGVGGVMALALLVNLALGLVLPILPLYARSFGVDYGQAGLLVAFYLARLTFDLVGGYVTDRLGITPAAAIGLLVVGVGAALTALSQSFPSRCCPRPEPAPGQPLSGLRCTRG
jgi:hypothetical protein